MISQKKLKYIKYNVILFKKKKKKGKQHERKKVQRGTGAKSQFADKSQK